MSVAVLSKFLIIAVCAGVLAAMFLLSLEGIDNLSRQREVSVELFGALVAVSVMSSFAIGLPVALLIFALSWRQLMTSPTTLAMTTILAGIMMVLASYAIGDETGVLILGIPAFIAALTYGILGWFWILRPLQRILTNPPPEKEIG